MLKVVVGLMGTRKRYFSLLTTGSWFLSLRSSLQTVSRMKYNCDFQCFHVYAAIISF